MGSLLNLIPGVSQLRLGLYIALGLFIVGLFGTIGYLKYENSQLENTVLKKQSLLDNANNVIQQEKEANQTLVRTIEQLKVQIAQIVRESQSAIKSDQNLDSIKKNNIIKLDDRLKKIEDTPTNKPDEYDANSEDFLRKYNEDLDCRRRNPQKLSACQ